MTRDLNGIRSAIKQTLPNADIRVEGVGVEGVHAQRLGGEPDRGAAGRRASPRGSPRAPATSSTALSVRGRDQVMLKVTVAEVAAQYLIKQLGIDLTGSLNYGTAVVNFNNTNALHRATARSLVTGNAVTAAFGSVAQRQRHHPAPWRSAGVVRTLAEPDLTAISGESATFVAGGEFPVPSGYNYDPDQPRSAPPS
ncbi:MAG: hypothetical protein MZV49_21450 [Rhodopseudomonas palustris]|nr:hypothetical protein [Rhodopseudomonas palustris]